MAKRNRDSDDGRPDEVSSRLRTFARARLDRVAVLGWYFTLGFAVATCALMVFAFVLDQVIDDAALVQWDRRVLLAVHERTSPLGLRIFFAISAFGSPALVALIGLFGLYRLRRAGARALVAAWIAAFVGAPLLNQIIKWAVHRNRPGFGSEYLFGMSYSFPSGHAMGATVAYGMIAYMSVHRPFVDRARLPLVYLLALLIVLAVAASRVYLGVHYPSDVIGGAAAGAAWLAICCTIAGALTRRQRAAVD